MMGDSGVMVAITAFFVMAMGWMIMSPVILVVVHLFDRYKEKIPWPIENLPKKRKKIYYKAWKEGRWPKQWPEEEHERPDSHYR